MSENDNIKELFKLLADNLDHTTYVDIVDLMLELNLGHPHFLDMSEYAENADFIETTPGSRTTARKLFKVIHGSKK
mgnify:FL=1